MTKHKGPFHIVEKLSPITYCLELPKKWNITDTFHATLLMLYEENNIHSPNYVQPSPDLIDGEEE